MYISRFQVRNYKSFREPAALEFTQGFNIISGQNNAGKTALLEALGLNFGVNPHRSVRTVPAPDAVPDQSSVAQVSFTVSSKEVQEYLLAMPPDNTYHLAKPDPGSEVARKSGYTDDSAQSVMRLVEAFFAQDPLTFTFRVTATDNGLSWGILNTPSYGLYAPQGGPGNWMFAPFQIGRGGQVTSKGGSAVNSTDLGMHLVGAFRRHIYRFAAERLKVGRSAHGANPLLAQDASNLPEVLGQLQHNPSRFRAINEN